MANVNPVADLYPLHELAQGAVHFILCAHWNPRHLYQHKANRLCT